MNTMTKIRLKQIAVLVLGMALLVSCEPQPQDGSNGPKRKKSAVEQKIDDNIGKLAKETSWAESQSMYGKIKADIGNKSYRIKTKVRNDLNSLADKAYCHSMDTIMYIILKGECKPRHKELYEIHKLRVGESFADVASTPFHKQVEEKYKSHEQMLKTILPDLRSSHQKPTTFESEYNDDLETKAVNKAKSYLAENPSCTEIRDGLTNVKDGKLFKSWRKAFCNKLVELYLEKQDWDRGDENAVKSQINLYNRKYPETPEYQQWLDTITYFRNEHQKNNN